MPVDSPTAKSKLREILKVPNPKDNCTAMRHLSTDTGAIYCMYDLMVAYAKAGRKSREGDKATGPLMFNAAMNPTMCNELGVTKNTAYRWRDRLVELGWIILVKKGEPRGDGKQEPNVYRVVEHDEFITAHPDSCPPYAEPYDLAARDAVREARRFIDDNTGRSFRFVGSDMTTAEAIVEAMSTLTAAEQAEVVQLWKSIEPDLSERPAPHKLPLPPHGLPATSGRIASYLHRKTQLPPHGFAATSA